MRILAIAAVMSLSPAWARAQSTESPVPFDSAQRVMAITPALALRLKLTAPVWPVTGEYQEARLFAVSPGDAFTLVVHRPSGASERFTLSTGDRDALRSAIDAAMSATGRPSAEFGADLVSEPAGNRFAARLTTLAALAYGPLAASLIDSPEGASAAWLLTTGLTFFVSYQAAQSTGITRAQSELAGDLGLASAGGALLLGYSATGDAERGVRAVALAGGVLGTVVGAAAAAKMSDAEAHGAMLGLRMGGALGVAASSFASGDGRSVAAASAAGMAIGYPLGLMYPRHASYLVTAGDAEAMGTSGLIGATWAAATLGDSGASGARVGATLGVGYLVGGLLGSQIFARPFNLTRSQSTVLDVGAVAGGLVGLAIPVLSDNNNSAVLFASAAGGATLGVAVLAGSFPLASKVRSPVAGRFRRLGEAQFSVSPLSALALTGRTPGRYSLVNVRF